MRFRRKDKLPEADQRRIRRDVSSHIHRADYGAALRAVAGWRRRYPGDLGIAATYRSLGIRPR